MLACPRCAAPPAAELALLEDVVPSILLFSDAPDLGRISAASATLRDLTEPAWRAVFASRWSALFQLRRAPEAWRSCCSARAVAFRKDLLVAGGRWRVRGGTQDRRGQVTTEGEFAFADGSLAASGQVVHRRGDSVMNGTWRGNLCALITLGAGVAPRDAKSRWTLVWREKIQHTAGSYDYEGELQELPGQGLSVQGEFSWFGRKRGTFCFFLDPFGAMRLV